MSGFQSRTSEMEIEHLAYFYRLFRPNELALVLELNKHWSSYDVDRCEKIARIIRKMFDPNQSDCNVRAAIDYFNGNPSLDLIHHKQLQTILAEDYATIHLDPCMTTCPLCQQQLYPSNAQKKNISIHCLRGEIQKGIVTQTLILIMFNCP
jgi:hypothetical protein